MVDYPFTRQDIVGAVVGVTLALGFTSILDAYPALADSFAIMAAILIAAGVADWLNPRPTKTMLLEGIVATAIVRQTLRRLDDQQRQRALDDAERELMSEWKVDIEFNREALIEDSERPLEDVLER